MIKVYGGTASPYVHRALVAARLKGHELAREPPPGGGMRSPEFQAISPLGRVPLLDHDGWLLAESRAIVGYLDAVLDGPSLFPCDPRQRARVALIEALTDCEITGVRWVLAGPVLGWPVSRDVVAAGRAQLGRGLAAVERSRDERDLFATGDTATAADCALLPMLTLLDVADPASGLSALLDRSPGLRRYQRRMDGHPVIGRTPPEMRVAFQALAAGRSAG